MRQYFIRNSVKIPIKFLFREKIYGVHNAHGEAVVDLIWMRFPAQSTLIRK